MSLAQQRRTERVSLPLGQTVITPAAMAAIPNDEILRSLARHAAGDWGDLSPADAEENELSLKNGWRLLSSYRSREGVKFWIITEADRSATTILLPEDY